MFRVEYYVDDKKLGASLLALVGLAHGQPGVVPVVNVEKKGNGLGEIVQGGNSLERFAEALRSMKGKTVVASDVRPLMKSLGMAPSSRGYLMKRSIKAGLLKKSGTGSASKYLVM